MKKLILMFTVCLIAVAGKVSAQGGTVAEWFPIKLTEGTNKMITIDNKETVQFVKKGNTFSEVIFKDAAGKTTRLAPARTVVPGAPKAECNSGNTVLFFNNGNIGMIICKNDQSAGGYHITLDLPGGGTSKAQNRRVEVKLSK